MKKIDSKTPLAKCTARTIQFCLVLLTLLLSGCYKNEVLNNDIHDVDEPATGLDIYIDENFVQKYKVAIRYKYKDSFVDAGKVATPVDVDKVKPMLEFIDYYWIQPYLEVTNGETYFRRYIPGEIIFLGGLIYNGDGTVTLGSADAGARITFTDVNSIDVNNEEWKERQLHTVYHEFSHTMHQNFKLPTNFEEITKTGYSGPGSWFSLTDEEALERGFVSSYATSSPNEDFAETVAFYLYDADFNAHFIDQEVDCATADCENRNEGKKKILEKLTAIIDHHDTKINLDLEELRNAIQARLN